MKENAEILAMSGPKMILVVHDTKLLLLEERASIAKVYI